MRERQSARRLRYMLEVTSPMNAIKVTAFSEKNICAPDMCFFMESQSERAFFRLFSFVFKGRVQHLVCCLELSGRTDYISIYASLQKFKNHF